MDKAGIVTVVSGYKNDQGVNNLGRKLQEATQKALEQGKKAEKAE